jgi:hypothetical protein
MGADSRFFFISITKASRIVPPAKALSGGGSTVAADPPTLSTAKRLKPRATPNMTL